MTPLRIVDINKAIVDPGRERFNIMVEDKMCSIDRMGMSALNVNILSSKKKDFVKLR